MSTLNALNADIYLVQIPPNQSARLSVALLLSLSLFSFQGAVKKKIHSAKALANASVPSKLNNVRRKEI